MIHLRTDSPTATRDLAAAVAELVRGGDLIVLAGDLGAGKTAFTQGLGAALGIDEPITSPTFTLARQYEGGRLRLHHLDAYRFDALAEVLDVGLAELLDDAEAVTVIEWGDAILAALPRDLLEIRLQLGEGDDDREIQLRLVGSSWSARRRALTTALDPWSVEVAGGPTSDGGAGGAGC